MTQAPSAGNSSTTALPSDSKSLVLEMVNRRPDGAQVGLRGRVVLSIHVSETGDVESVSVISGEPALAETAVIAAKKFEFQPYIRGGRAIKVQTKIPVDVYSDGNVIVSQEGTQLIVPFGNEANRPNSAGVAAAAKSSGEAPSDRRLRTGVVAGILLQRVAPVYPREAREKHIQGTVVLQGVIGKDGHIKNLRAVSGPKELIEAGCAAVAQWVYRPYELNGEPIEIDTRIAVSFQLTPGAARPDTENRRAIYTIP